ncbi:unnamed protein product [Ilex paraguariensis]|uniref:PGG domain-containing protein n=1 Tax=Ilex paraguariensis TaxID=185542 RepID=A0ABC8S2I8_9AQUA
MHASITIFFCDLGSPTKLENLTDQQSGGDIENPGDGFISVPQVKNIQEAKLIHLQAIQLAKLICDEIGKLDNSTAALKVSAPLKTAVMYGNCEVAEEILSISSKSIYVRDKSDHTIFHLSIANRRENIFNLIHQYGEVGYNFLNMVENEGNCGLHLAGCLGSHVKLNLRATAAGAALQMQRELLWFKEVEKITLAHDRERKNNNGKTPKMLFTETHEDLVKEGEKWMKDTSTSCTIVAALIVTVVFAAAITVPGGNKGDGLPNFSKETGFRVFAISDALALFSSSSSLIMFLSILTSRYAEEDFLYALPKRLIIGLVTLFLSMIFMMTAFGAALFLVFGDKNAWILTAVVALACVPVILFASLQFPLLLDMIKSTYGPGIFGKKSDRMLY